MVVVFDLDDTLYPERDFVRSGFRAVAQRLDADHAVELARRMEELWDAGDPDAIGRVLSDSGSDVEKADLLSVCRGHRPTLALADGVAEFLAQLAEAGCTLGVLTDGRTATQTNKIAALGIEPLLAEVVISEAFGSAKPDERNFRHFESAFPGRRYAYVGDNLSKDFVTPNRFGWLTIGLRDHGENIHPQAIDVAPADHRPRLWVDRLA